MMRRITVVGLLIALAACDRSPTAPEEFVIKVDSLIAPNAVAYGQPFTIAFHGTIGESTCSSLRRVVRDHTWDAVDFTFVGERCTTGNGRLMMVHLNQSELVSISRLGHISVRVHQPDGSILTKELTVQ